MQPKKYAGIGSRNTPNEILKVMKRLGTHYANNKYLLRSGNCQGADQAFQHGVNIVEPHLIELFLPNKNYNKKKQVKGNRIVYDQKHFKEALVIASQIHLRWSNLSKMGKIFHGRSVQMILGYDLQTPSDFVICWTHEAKEVGGTAIGIILAKEKNIPVLNLANKEHLNECLRTINV
ncbi:hypothetical protein [Candidatus Uabimicrobium sp. HlEnr_7]|uniref:hypothetical protein n=1 Tax=Candidatus Uabimicrobium helgolandensis TaxID=3095367 RepID=UPI003556EEC5